MQWHPGISLCVRECAAKTNVPSFSHCCSGEGADPEGLATYMAKAGIVLEAYSPLGTNNTALIKGPLTTKIGAAHNKSGAQVALHWIWQHGHALTTKSSKATHLAEDADLFDWEVTAAELAELDAATTPIGKPSFMCSK